MSEKDIMTSVAHIVYRLKRVPPRRLPIVVGRYTLRTARARARRWYIKHNAGELSDDALRRSLRGIPPDVAFGRFLERFFIDPRSARATAAWLVRAYPRLAQRTRDRAAEALDHCTDLLGPDLVSLGPKIDWHRDFRTGVTWPRTVLADDQDYLRLDETCDVKMPWELSRAHHWVTLGRAYALEPDPRYAREFVAQLESWLDDNPWPYGVNWGRAMEVAVRAVNWIWAAAFFADAPEFTPLHRTRFLRAMLQHGRHILDNLEFADTNGNHYLSNGVGLIFLGVVFAEFSESAAWRNKGFEIVWGEILQQVHPDGVDFEQGIGYHGLVAEFWYACVLLCEANGVAVPPHVRARLSAMYDFMLTYTRPDGTFPQIGDNDDGRLANLDDEPVGSHRRHLAVGGVMFGRAELTAAAGDAVETALWLCGTQALDAQLGAAAQPTPVPSRAFPHGGFYFMRTPGLVLTIDAGDIGMRGIGGHGHADVLSFDLWAMGGPLLSDSGTYTYTGDPVARNVHRATAAHNTLRVDGQDSSRLGGTRWLWLIENDAHPRDVTWQSDAECDSFRGTHDGYARLTPPVLHTRQIAFHKSACHVRIEDRLTGTGDHRVELFFHPAVEHAVTDDGILLHGRNGHQQAWLFGPPGMTLDLQEGWISRGYGVRERAHVLVYSMRAPVRMPMTLRTDLVVVARDTPKSVARSLLTDL
ncbi:MAG: hypothetical protein NVSMB2_14620 [Chloroflexota bacterium]